MFVSSIEVQGKIRHIPSSSSARASSVQAFQPREPSLSLHVSWERAFLPRQPRHHPHQLALSGSMSDVIHMDIDRTACLCSRLRRCFLGGGLFLLLCILLFICLCFLGRSLRLHRFSWQDGESLPLHEAWPGPSWALGPPPLHPPPRPCQLSGERETISKLKSQAIKCHTFARGLRTAFLGFASSSSSSASSSTSSSFFCKSY